MKPQQGGVFVKHIRKVSKTIVSEHKISNTFAMLRNSNFKWEHDGIKFKNIGNKKDEMYVKITVYANSKKDINKIHTIFNTSTS